MKELTSGVGGIVTYSLFCLLLIFLSLPYTHSQIAFNQVCANGQCNNQEFVAEYDATASVLDCNGAGSPTCHNITIRVTKSTHVYINCNGANSCLNVSIIADNESELDFTCDSSSTCNAVLGCVDYTLAGNCNIFCGNCSSVCCYTGPLICRRCNGTTPSAALTSSSSPSAANTDSPSISNSVSRSPSTSLSNSPSNSRSLSASRSLSSSSSRAPSFTPTNSATPSPSSSPATPSSTPSIGSSQSPTPSTTNSASATPSFMLSKTASESQAPSALVSPSSSSSRAINTNDNNTDVLLSCSNSTDYSVPSSAYMYGECFNGTLYINSSLQFQNKRIIIPQPVVVNNGDIILQSSRLLLELNSFPTAPFLSTPHSFLASSPFSIVLNIKTQLPASSNTEIILVSAEQITIEQSNNKKRQTSLSSFEVVSVQQENGCLNSDSKLTDKSISTLLSVNNDNCGGDDGGEVNKGAVAGAVVGVVGGLALLIIIIVVVAIVVVIVAKKARDKKSLGQIVL